jgi:hypothetical protein
LPSILVNALTLSAYLILEQPECKRIGSITEAHHLVGSRQVPLASGSTAPV